MTDSERATYDKVLSETVEALGLAKEAVRSLINALDASRGVARNLVGALGDLIGPDADPRLRAVYDQLKASAEAIPSAPALAALL